MKKVLNKLFSKKLDSKFFLFSNILFWLTIFITFFVTGISNLDPDFAWHLKVGQDIAINKQVPMIETYIFPTLGESWVDHEWLSNLLLFLIYNLFGKFGYWALGLIFASIATFTLFLVSKMTRVYFLSKLHRWDFFFLNSLFLLLGFHSLIRAYGIRLQIFTWLFFVLCFMFYFKISKEKKWGYLFAFPTLFGFWANLHGTFVLGLAIALCLLVLIFWENQKAKLRIWTFSSAIASVIITLFTPYGIEIWKLVVGEYTQNTTYLEKIFEWLPLYAAPYIEWYTTFYISFIFIIFLFSVITKKLVLKKNFLFYYCFLLIMLIASVKARRFVSMFILCSFPFAVFATAQLFNRKIIKQWFGWLVVITTIPILVYQTYFISTVPFDLLTQNTSMSPYNAVEFLKKDPLLKNYRSFNNYGWGGYLVWMYPEKLHFIDGRMPQKQLPSGISLIEEYHEFYESPDKTKEKMEQYNMKVALIPQKQSFEKSLPYLEKFILKYLFSIDLNELDKIDPLREYLETNWKKVYEDNISIVYTIKNSN